MFSTITLQYVSVYLCDMWAHLRTSSSNRSTGSWSTSVSLGSSVTSLSLGARLTISTLRLEEGRRSSKFCCIVTSLKASKSVDVCLTYDM